MYLWARIRDLAAQALDAPEPVLRTSMAFSALLHGVVIVLLIFGLPFSFERRDYEPAPIIVELLPVAEKTTPPKREEPPIPEPPEIAPPVAEPPKEEPKLAEVPKPEPPLPEPPKPEPKVVEAPKPAPPEPEPPKPEPPKPEPVETPPPPPPPEKMVALAVPEPAPTPKPKPAPPPKPVQKRSETRKVPKPKPKPKVQAKPPPKTKDFDADRIAALLNKKLKAAPQRQRPPEKKDEVRKRIEERVAARASQPAISAPQLTLSEKDAIRAQIERCWIVPAGARDAESLVVEIRVFLNPDGSLLKPPEIVDGERMSEPGQEFFRAAAESARRAVQKCNPLRNLPIAKYQSWREIELTFNPREMLGG